MLYQQRIKKITKRRTKHYKMKKLTRKRKTKGGKLYLDDPYKNSEGPQY